MTRPVPTWARNAAALLTAALIGVCIGITIAPQRPPTALAYCATDGTPNTFPCPPDTDRWVMAWWPNTVTTARWTGDKWEFRTPVLGQRSTTHPAIAWEESHEE